MSLVPARGGQTVNFVRIVSGEKILFGLSSKPAVLAPGISLTSLPMALTRKGDSSPWRGR